MLLKSVVAGLALACCSPVLAEGPLHVTTDFSAGISPIDNFKANLESIGAGMELAAPTFVTVDPNTELTFRLLESRTESRGLQINSLVVDGSEYAFGLQAFNPTGTVLGTHILSGSFNDLIGFTDSLSGPDAPPLFWPEAFQVYINSADADNLTGIGPFIGRFDTLYFSIANAALFQVSVASPAVPEPASWALMISGFAISGAAIRRKRRTAFRPSSASARLSFRES